MKRKTNPWKAWLYRALVIKLTPISLRRDLRCEGTKKEVDREIWWNYFLLSRSQVDEGDLGVHAFRCKESTAIPLNWPLKWLFVFLFSFFEILKQQTGSKNRASPARLLVRYSTQTNDVIKTLNDVSDQTYLFRLVTEWYVIVMVQKYLE